jgi:hypothetical protein
MPNMANSRRQHKGRALARATKTALLHRSDAIAATFRSSKWITGTEPAQWLIAAARSDNVEHHRLGDGLTGILREQVVLAGL